MSKDLTMPLPFLVTDDVVKEVVDTPALPNSVMNREQSDRFIDLLIDESVLLKRIRREKKDNSKGEINKLDLGTIVTEGAAATSKARTSVPTEAVVTYDMVKYRSAFDLRTDFQEDNLEGPAIRDKILGMFTKRMAIDIEMAAIEGDESLSTGDAQTNSNNLLGGNDGFNQILVDNVPAAQQIDAAGAAPSKQLYYEMKRAIPSRYRAAKPMYNWIVPSGPFDKWMLEWSNRETQGGDSALANGTVPGPWGIGMLEVPLMPEDLSWGTSGTDGSQIWLTPFENLILFVRREITIEFERKPRLDLWEATIHYKVDFEVENPDLVIIATNVAMSGSDYTG